MMKSLFVPQNEPTDEQMQKSARLLIKEAALASCLFSLGTGNVLAGYLAFLGASPSYCALIAALPQLGCVMQLVSPFLFERLRYRKGAITILCFVFRASLSFAGLAPFIFANKNVQLSYVFVIYFMAFLAAGFVTPGLNRWVMEIAPQNSRGRFFAKKDIFASICNAGISLLVGRWLDYNIKNDNSLVGFTVVFCVTFALSVLDATLLCNLHERAAPKTKLNLKALFTPLQDKNFKPYIWFMVFWHLAQGFCTPFLPTYMVSQLGLSHTFIAGMSVAASVAGMGGIWLWGRMADKKSWQKVMLLSGACVATVYAFWGFVTKDSAIILAPVLQCALGACNGAFNTSSMNLQYQNSPQKGKTVYLGVASALFNMAAYIAALVAAAFVKTVSNNSVSGVPILLMGSGVSMLLVLAFFRKALK